MKHINLPFTAEEFNSNIKNGTFNPYDVWSLEFDLYQIPKIYTKNDKTWKIYNINNYYVIAVFHNKIGEKKEIDGGRLVEVYAAYSLLEIIQENEVQFWEKSVRSHIYSSKQEQKERLKYFRYYYYIYVDEDFKNLASIISDYFKNDRGLYPIDLNDRLIKDKELKEIWDTEANPYEQQFYAALYNSSDSSNSIDNEVGVTLINIHQQLYSFTFNEYYNCDKLVEIDLTNKSIDNPIPEIIFERCSNIPHLIKISSSKSRFNLEYENLVFELLNKFNGNAFLLTPDLNIIGIKPNKYIPITERKYYLYESTENYFSDVSLKNMELDILIEMEEYWEQLHENSKKFLRTGYFLFKRSESGSEFLLDTSIASLTYSKCVENEMVQRIVLPFKEHFENNFKLFDVSLDLEDINLKKMTSFLIGKDITPPELGTFSYFLKNVIHSKKRANWSVSINAFKSYCQTIEDSNFILNEELLYTMLSQIAKKYRNGGAHIKVLPIEYVTEFHKILFEQNFLKKFINATRIVNNKIL